MRHRLVKVIPMQIRGTEMKAVQLGCWTGYFVVAVHAKGMHCGKQLNQLIQGFKSSEHTVRAF